LNKTPPPLTPEQIDAYCENLAKAGTEHAHQRAFFGWLNMMKYREVHPLAHMAFAIPNGGKRDAITAARLKAEGVKAGVADICYPVPNKYHSLWVELKKPLVGRLSEDQSDWAVYMRTCGHAVCTAFGWRAARQAFLEYTAGTPVALVYT
jgi:hypothetical protein